MASPDLPLSDEAWVSDPTCSEGCAEQVCKCNNYTNYGIVVLALPEAERVRFTCACCPNKPGCALLAFSLLPLPQTFLVWGAWVASWKIRQLRQLVAPPRYKVGSLVSHCICCHGRLLLQMRREVEARVARGLPAVPAYPLLAPGQQRMV